MQLNLPMLTYYQGPRLIAPEIVAAITTYREAVRTCWKLKTRANLTKAQLARDAGLYASHVTDYISDSEVKRELPAKHIAAFEVECGNRVISQWLASRANLTIMEQFIIDQRRVA